MKQLYFSEHLKVHTAVLAKTKGYVHPAKIILAFVVVHNFGCAGDSLGGRSIEGDSDRNRMVPPPLPIQGNIWHAVSRSYRRVPNGTAGSLQEAQSSGFVCLGPAVVEDRYEDDLESTLVAPIRVVGTPDGGPVQASDGANPMASASDVDALLAPLWFSSLSFPSVDHGFDIPQSLAFSSRSAFAPPDQGLSELFFFDVRPSSDGQWSGWESYLLELFAYFGETFGSAFLVSPDFHEESFGPHGCETLADVAQCTTSGCAWEQNRCVDVFQVRLVWRESLGIDRPQGMPEQVLHSVRAVFSTDGILDTYLEFIVPDLSPTEPVRETAEACLAASPCQTATVTRREEPWAEAFCTF